MTLDPELNMEQRAVVLHPGEAFVLACPGSGKTRTIVERVAFQLPVLPPRRGMAVLSFTSTAVAEFRERCHRKGLGAIFDFPSFVGTFDAFIGQFLIQPTGLKGCSQRPMILECWANLGVVVRRKGNHRLPGGGVPLDFFDPATDQLNPVRLSQEYRSILQEKEEWEKAARRTRQYWRRSGYITAADARVELHRKLTVPAFAEALATILAARFAEIIVDEAQDSNALDVAILRWLRERGVRLVVVCDPDQAIYEFRGSQPDVLAEFTQHLPKLSLVGNYRSSPCVCQMASSLRSRPEPDQARRSWANSLLPVQLLSYQGRSVPASVGEHFLLRARQLGVDPDDCILLSHQGKQARRAAGWSFDDEQSPPESRVARMAEAVVKFRTREMSGKSRAAALLTVEKLVLELMLGSQRGTTGHPRKIAEENGIQVRWLARVAFQLLIALPSICTSEKEAAETWVDQLRSEIDRLVPDRLLPLSVKQFLRTPSKKNWSTVLLASVECCRHDTVHGAKGHEYDGVCFVMPPSSERTSALLDGWENRVGGEAERVFYVAVTRAKRLLALAVPEKERQRIERILTTFQIDWELSSMADTGQLDLFSGKG